MNSLANCKVQSSVWVERGLLRWILIIPKQLTAQSTSYISHLELHMMVSECYCVLFAGVILLLFFCNKKRT